MGAHVNFEGISGYLAGDGPAGVIVLHEQDGLVPHIRDVTATLGFCTGGALSLLTSALYPVDATVAYYGIFAGRGERNSTNPVLVHVAEHEEHNPPASPEHFPTWFEGMSNVELHIYPGTQHAFFNDTYPDNYDEAAASLSWSRTVSFLHKHLSP